MNTDSHADILKRGVKAWNRWRADSPSVRPILVRSQFVNSDLRGADLHGANLMKAELCGAQLQGSELSSAVLVRADLRGAQLSGANLVEANLSGANLYKADLTSANLSRCNLQSADLVDATMKHAVLTGCRVYGVAAWNLNLDGVEQSDLVITRNNEPIITVDHLDVAQFIYLILNNSKIREVINTITSKVVLILGRFTPDRKVVLDAIRDALRRHDYLPVLFDFDRPSNRDLSETVATLAHMARFVIADITDARSIPQELMLIAPNLPSVPIQPLLLATQNEYGMFDHFRRFPWVLEPAVYENSDQLLREIESLVISPAERRLRSA